MARFCIENDVTKAKASKAVEGIDGLINAMKSAEYLINSAIETINNDDELDDLYFESKQGFINKLQEERLSFLRFGDICFEYDQEVNGPFLMEYQKVVDLISDIKSDEISIPNNIGATETEYYTDGQYGNRDTKTRTKIKETIGFQDVLSYGDIGDLFKQNYENYCKTVEGGKDTYPEFEDYLNGLITRGEFEYEIPTPWKEYLSIAIDCIPIIGDAKSLVEAVVGVDLITGRYLSALERSFCLVAIIPLVGDSVKIGGKGAKLAMKSFGEELLKNVAIMSGTSGLANMGINPVLCMGIYAGGKGTKGAINLLKNSDVLKKFELPKRQVLNTIAFKSDEVKKFIQDTKIVNGEYHVTLKQKIEGVTKIIFKESDLTPMQKFGCTIGCFTEETLVITEAGLKPICEIVRGEKVLSQNEETGVQTYEEVDLIRKVGQDIITLTIENERINTTPEHPFMTEIGWVEARNLSVGSRVLTKNNLYEIVENMEIKSYNYVKTYNLTVSNNHNFFITNLGVMVHNMDCKNVKLGDIYKEFGDKISDPSLKEEFKGVIKKLDEIDEAKGIAGYINEFDPRFKGLDPNDGEGLRKLIDGANDEIKKLLEGVSNSYGLTSKDIPSVRNSEFNKFFNSLTTEELDEIWKDPKLRQTIEDRLRQPGGLHEWHLVSRTPQFKNWNVTAEQIKDLRSLTTDVKFVNPKGVHGGRGSTTAHNELLKIIDGSTDYDTFIRRLNNWANYRLDGGIESLPKGLQLK